MMHIFVKVVVKLCSHKYHHLHHPHPLCMPQRPGALTGHRKWGTSWTCVTFPFPERDVEEKVELTFLLWTSRPCWEGLGPKTMLVWQKASNVARVTNLVMTSWSCRRAQKEERPENKAKAQNLTFTFTLAHQPGTWSSTNFQKTCFSDLHSF